MSERGNCIRWARAAACNPAFASELEAHVSRALARSVEVDAPKAGDRAPDSLNPGRSQVDFFSVQGRPLVLRHYCRGGMVRHLLRDSFFRLPLTRTPYRPFEELQILERLSLHGVAVPTPVLGAATHLYCGWLYRAVIVTEELPEVQNLLFLALSAKLQSEEQAAVAELCKRAGAEAAKMVAQGVTHPDLHLGNVLVQRRERVVLIDFDRASDAPDAPRVRQQLVTRWNRSLQKHGVAEFTLGAFEAGLNTI